MDWELLVVVWSSWILLPTPPVYLKKVNKTETLSLSLSSVLSHSFFDIFFFFLDAQRMKCSSEVLDEIQNLSENLKSPPPPSPLGQPPELLHKLIPLPFHPHHHLLSELSLFQLFLSLFLISSHHWKYQWWWKKRGATKRRVNVLLIALMWIRCEHNSPLTPLQLHFN